MEIKRAIADSLRILADKVDSEFVEGFDYSWHGNTFLTRDELEHGEAVSLKLTWDANTEKLGGAGRYGGRWHRQGEVG